MKRYFLLVIAICFSLVSFAQKAPKKSFSTENTANGIQWQNGSLINMYDGDDGKGTVYTAEVSGDMTYFWGRGAGRSDEGNWFGVYPAASLNKWEGNVLHFVIPHEQVAGKVESPMYSRTSDSGLIFNPLTAYLKFTLASDVPPLKEIRFTTTKFVSGTYKVDLGVRNPGVALDEGDRFRELVFRPEEGSLITPGDYTMAIFARVLPDGMNVEFVNEEGKTAQAKIGAEIKLALGKTKDLGVVTDLKFDNGADSAVGSAYSNNGVVFWISPDDKSKGKAVAATADVVKWAETESVYGIHGFKENYDKVHSTILGLPAYKANPDNFKAVNACEQMRKTHGGNWHVPSATEMKYLFNAYYGKSDQTLPENGVIYDDPVSLAAAARFDKQLEALGGEKMFAGTTHYWICGQNSNGKMQYVNMKTFHNGNDIQAAQKYVRCVLDFNSLEADGNSRYPGTEIGKTLKSEICHGVVDILWDTTYTVSPGMDYYQMKVVTESYDKMDMHLIKVDQSKGVTLRVGWSDQCTSSKWVRQTPADMAAHMDSPSNPVYAIVNADFCENRIPIRPRGPMHCDGKILANSYSIDPRFTHQALSYVGVTFDGKMIIGPSAHYPAMQKSLKECTGGGVILLQNHEIQGGYVETDPARDPRTALGYTSDNVVWLLVVDGRHKGTEGMTYMEMATIFKALGCETAVNLDGGGSTQLLVKDTQTGKMEMRNWPSDPTVGFGGRERPRLNAWYVTKK